MAGRAAQLAIDLVEHGASDVASGMDDVTGSAKRMGDATDAAGRQAKTAGDRMDSAAGGADEMASKGAQAAGAMSGLGDLIGGPFGAAMATGGIGLQAMADSGDLLNAALENSVVSTARAKVGTIAKAAADKAAAVATKAMTVAQKALNLAQRASPIGLIITGVLLLVGAIILAYRNSSKFRAIVQGAMNAAKSAVDKVKAAFSGLGPIVGKVMSFIGKVVGIYVKVYVAYFKLGLTVATAAWNGIKAVVSRVVDAVTGKVRDIRAAASDVFGWVKSHGQDAFNALIAPLQRVIDLIDSILDKISKIHIPHPDLNPFNGRATTSGRVTVPSSTAAPVVIQLTVNPAPGTTATQAQQTAQASMDAIDARLRTLGRRPVFSR